MPKHFLPIPSVEKYLKNVLIDCKNNDIYKKINDDLFQLTPLSDVINKYRNIEREDNDGKLFYSFLLSAMNERNINEQIFVQYIAEIIKDTIDFSSLNSFLKGI